MTSEQLQDKFQELNQTYFNGELPVYTLVAYRHLKSRLGLHKGAKREIQVDCTLEGDDAVACLLHEMVHAKVGDIHGHDKVFNAEAERVERLSGLNLRTYRHNASEDYEALIRALPHLRADEIDEYLKMLRRNRYMTKEEHEAYQTQIRELMDKL